MSSRDADRDRDDAASRADASDPTASHSAPCGANVGILGRARDRRPLPARAPPRRRLARVRSTTRSSSRVAARSTRRARRRGVARARALSARHARAREIFSDESGLDDRDGVGAPEMHRAPHSHARFARRAIAASAFVRVDDFDRILYRAYLARSARARVARASRRAGFVDGNRVANDANDRGFARACARRGDENGVAVPRGDDQTRVLRRTARGGGTGPDGARARRRRGYPRADGGRCETVHAHGPRCRRAEANARLTTRRATRDGRR